MGFTTKTAFESNHFLFAQDGAKKDLQAALTIDPLHILPDRMLRGAPQKVLAVMTIQNALERLRRASFILDLKAIPQSETLAGSYGPVTEANIVLFKTKLQVMRPGQTAVDPITGRGTLAALDDAMAKVEDKPVVTDTIDVYVKILGFATGLDQGRQQDSAGTRQDVLSPKYAATGRELLVLQFLGSSDHRNPTERIVGIIADASRGKRKGFACLMGESAGGRNVLEVAARLRGMGFSLGYLGMADAALDDRDCEPPASPLSRVPLARNIHGVVGARMVNIFQSAGNSTTFAVRQGRLVWFGKMEPTHEVHGNIRFWPEGTDVDKTSENATLAHTNAATNAIGPHDRGVNAFLALLPKARG